MKLSVCLVAAALASSAVACSNSTAHLQTPAGFAELAGQKSFDYRATSPRGIVLAARAETNEPAANGDFWAEAIDLRLKKDGYAPDGKKDVVTASGLKGKELRYTLERNGRPYRYWIAVFVTKNKVLLAEATGDRAHFDGAEETVDKALVSVKAD